MEIFPFPSTLTSLLSHQSISMTLSRGMSEGIHRVLFSGRKRRGGREEKRLYSAERVRESM
jgi:hypothetical protein